MKHFFFFFFAGVVGREIKTNIQFVSFRFTAPSLKQITRLGLKRVQWGGRKKHLLGCPSEALPEEALVHTPQQEKQLGLRVGARRTRAFAPARVLQDVGEPAAEDFSREASVF